jgi:hypothetical protein
MSEQKKDKAIRQRLKRAKISPDQYAICSVCKCELSKDTDGYACCPRCGVILHISCGEWIGERCPTMVAQLSL